MILPIFQHLQWYFTRKEVLNLGFFPPGSEALNWRGVHKIKLDPEGNIARYNSQTVMYT